MTPTTLLIIGIISLFIGAIAAFINIATASSTGRSILSVMVCHAFAGLFWIGGGITTLVAIVMFLINYAKH
jgi:hypothetical protein